jgi:hypothetical protein
MIVKQLSIFLENKQGRLTEVAKMLGEANINMTAFSIADNSDFGILRLIVSDPEQAYELLHKNKFAVTLTDVVCLYCPNTPGSLAKALDILNKENIFIEYMYAFSRNESAYVIIKAQDMIACTQALQKHKLELIAADDLYKL